MFKPFSMYTQHLLTYTAIFCLNCNYSLVPRIYSHNISLFICRGGWLLCYIKYIYNVAATAVTKSSDQCEERVHSISCKVGVYTITSFLMEIIQRSGDIRATVRVAQG